MKRLLIFLFFSVSFFGFSYKTFNNGIVRGILTDDKKQPVPYATLMLKNTADSVLYKGELTNENGSFTFENLKEGNYYLEIKTLGYEIFRSRLILISEQNPMTDLGTLSLRSNAQNLNAVTITTDKPFIERLVDRTVVNIENSLIHQGSSIMDVMEKLPAVQVNQDGQINLKGKSGLIIMIDGKPTGMSGQDLANMLKGMSSSNVQKIEIITNPPAKYDAAGNAGIINIIMKKNRKEGFSGGINSSYGQGRYEKMSAGFNLGFKNTKYNLFANYTFSHRKGFNNLVLTRKFYNGDTLNTVFDTYNYILFPFNTHNLRMGSDFYLSKKTTFSILASGVNTQFNPTADNHTNILDGNNNIVNSYDFSNRSVDKFHNYSVNTELKHQFDSTGKELIVDLDYAAYGNNADQKFTTTLNDANGAFIGQNLLVGDQNGSLTIYSGKADYSNPLKDGSKFEAGVKSSYVESNSNVKFYNKFNEDLIFDSTRSNHFIYTENINAAYINYNKEFKKLSVQLGLRAEHTNANGKQIITGQTFHRNYAQLFPSMFFDYKLNEKHGLNLSLSRRIDRPAYQQMNPFRKLIDATTYAEGNPYLLPQISYNSELTYSYFNTVFLTLGYSYTTNNITDVLVQDGAKRVTVQTVANLAEVHSYNANLVFTKKLTKWWTTNTSLFSYYSKYTGTVNNYSFNQGWPSFTFNTSNSFPLAKGLSAELSFIYNHKTLYGVTFINPNYNLTVGLQQSILKKHGSITINFSDILWRAWPSGVTQFGNVNEHWKAVRDTRILNISFNYRFGKGQAKMRRNTGADDEKNRAG
jgi:hypothetical protein